MEHNPEFFGRVTMLYIPVEINGVKVKAFVDSGAQATIMSPDCAERCNVMKFLDERFQGMATGVGSAKILGRIHSAQIKLGNQFLPISMSVMEGKDVDLLFGLDVLRRHQACIDLRKNCLLINDEEIRFLSEHELPEKARYFGESAPGPSNENQAILHPSPATEETKTKYSEETIKLLTDMGIGRSEAIHALDSAGGNPDAAVSLLFQF